ncbi:MAG: hypothetical protein AAFV09_12975 [Pseudomonadota bacterium]
MTDLSRIEALVDEVVTRRALDARLERKGRWDWLKHPLLLTLVAFLLTTILGTAFDRVLREREMAAEYREEDRASVLAMEADARAAVQDIVRIAYERSLALDLLRSAILRGAAAEAEARKASYDASYMTWNIALPENVQRLRQISNPVDLRLIPREEGIGSSSGISAMEAVFEAGESFAFVPSDAFEWALVGGLGQRFRGADACVTAAYDRARVLDFVPLPVFIHDRCEGLEPGRSWGPLTRDAMFSVRACAYEIGTTLDHMISTRREQQLNWIARGNRLADFPAPDNSALMLEIEARLAAMCGDAAR